MDKQVIAMRRSPKTYFICGGITAALVAVIFGLSIWMLTLGSATVAAIVFMVVAVLFAVFVAFTFVYGAHLNRAPKEIIYCEDGTLYVSGRSLGRVNVQLVCEKLGGGGHLTMAGAQLYQLDGMDEALSLVRQSINEYLQESGDADAPALPRPAGGRGKSKLFLHPPH